jgi:hypothetical protein
MGSNAAATRLMLDLSLLEAFRQCGPRLGVPEIDAIREAAATRLLDELRRLARRMEGFNPDIRDEAAQVVMIRLFKAGPRGTRHDDPDTDERLRGWLVTAIRNASRDLLPKRAFDEITTTIEGGATNPVGRPDHQLEAQDRESRAHHLAAEATARLRDVVGVTAAELGGAAGERFLATVEELSAIAEGRLSFDRLVEAELAATGATSVTVRNRFYKRYSRALERVVDRIAQSRAAGTLASAQEEAALLAALDQLRLRQDQRR